MKILPTIVASLLLGAFAVPAVAGPAPWYRWRSKADGKLVCANIRLGPGWERAAGPFRDARCEKLLPAKS